MELIHGRPINESGRLEKEIRSYDFLDSLGIDYSRVDHEPAMTMEVCEEIDKVLMAPTCKNLFLCNRQQTEFYLLLMPASKPFKTKDLSAQIGSARLSFGSAEHMEKLLDITPGSCSVLGTGCHYRGGADILCNSQRGCIADVGNISIKIHTECLA